MKNGQELHILGKFLGAGCTKRRSKHSTMHSLMVSFAPVTEGASKANESRPSPIPTPHFYDQLGWSLKKTMPKFDGEH